METKKVASKQRKKRIKQLISSRTPFAVMKYYETTIFSGEYRNEILELLCLDENPKMFYIENFRRFDSRDFKEFREVFSGLELVEDTEDGKVYEFNGFRQYYFDCKIFNDELRGIYADETKKFGQKIAEDYLNENGEKMSKSAINKIVYSDKAQKAIQRNVNKRLKNVQARKV